MVGAALWEGQARGWVVWRGSIAGGLPPPMVGARVPGVAAPPLEPRRRSFRGAGPPTSGWSCRPRTEPPPLGPPIRGLRPRQAMPGGRDPFRISLSSRRFVRLRTRFRRRSAGPWSDSPPHAVRSIRAVRPPLALPAASSGPRRVPRQRPFVERQRPQPPFTRGRLCAQSLSGALPKSVIRPETRATNALIRWRNGTFA